MINLTEFANFLQTLTTGNHDLSANQIADELEKYGDQLKSSASVIRNGGNPLLEWNGTQDKVRIEVVRSPTA